MLLPPNADDVLSQGYQLHIKFPLSKGDIDCIKPIVESRNLALKDEPEKQLLVIYKPMTDKNQLLDVHSNKWLYFIMDKMRGVDTLWHH